MASQTRRTFGALRRLPSKRWQASYIAPDARRHVAPLTFDSKGDADAWLAAQRTDIARGDWQRPLPPPRVETFTTYAATWLDTRQLRPRTRAEYVKLLQGHLLPTFGSVDLEDITPAMVRAWHAELGERTGPTRRAHAYALLRTILATAVDDDALAANPCRIRGAGTSRRAKPIRPATLAELAAIADAMPARYRAAVLRRGVVRAALRGGRRAAPQGRRPRRRQVAGPPGRHPRQRRQRRRGAQVRGRRPRRGHPAPPRPRAASPSPRPHLHRTAKRSSSPRPTAATSARTEPCTAPSAPLAPRPAAMTSPSTACATPAPPSPPPPAPPSPS